MCKKGGETLPKAKVQVLSETNTGLNNKVSVNGVIMTNNRAYNEAKRGNIDGYHGVCNEEGVKYIRSNPDSSTKNNLDD